MTARLIVEGLQNVGNDITKEFKILCEILQPYAPALMERKIHDEELAELTRAISTTISRLELTDLLKQVTYDSPNIYIGDSGIFSTKSIRYKTAW